MTTKILPCKCKHRYQDNKYGTGMRVHNKTGDSPPKFRCTVCKAEK